MNFTHLILRKTLLMRSQILHFPKGIWNYIFGVQRVYPIKKQEFDSWSLSLTHFCILYNVWAREEKCEKKYPKMKQSYEKGEVELHFLLQGIFKYLIQNTGAGEQFAVSLSEAFICLRCCESFPPVWWSGHCPLKKKSRHPTWRSLWLFSTEIPPCSAELCIWVSVAEGA